MEVKDADALVAKIKNDIVPSAWEDAGGNCDCKLASPVGSNRKRLVVNANVHNVLQRLLQDAPRKKVVDVPSNVENGSNQRRDEQ